MAEVKNRDGKVTRAKGGPRLEILADLVSDKTVWTYRCQCRPEDNHDHEALMAEQAALLDRHDAVADDYRALEGEKGQAGLGFTITDCKIRRLGPANFELRVAWVDDDGIEGGFAVDSDVPDSFPAPQAILQAVRDAVLADFDAYQAATTITTAHVEKANT